jgi:hypothetical protein
MSERSAVAARHGIVTARIDARNSFASRPTVQHHA